jgi:hypothetical protein
MLNVVIVHYFYEQSLHCNKCSSIWKFPKIVNFLFWLFFGVNGFVRKEDPVAQIITCCLRYG